jgi:hypothetical protein
MAVGSIVARILTQYSDKGSKAAAKDINKLGKNFDAFASKATKAFGLAAAASAAFAVKVGVDAVKGAIEDQKQQIALATALRNTTGATDEAIAATVTYLDKLELLVGVDNNQLIPSLQILTQATKDVTSAQQLQNLALDISAGTTKDLGAVSLALAKAVGGNVGALTRLGVPLDANAVKAKDLNAILAALSATFEGQAEKRAETLEFGLMKLQLAFNQIADQVGYALLPIIKEFANYIITDVLPVIQSWVDLNKDQLASGLKTAAENAIALGKAVFGFVDFISRNMTTIKIFGTLIASIFVASKVYAFAKAIALLIPTLRTFAATAASAGVATALLTGGFSAGAAAAALGAFAVTAGAIGVSLAASSKNANKATKSFKGMGNISMTTGKQMTGLNKVVNTNTKFTFDNAGAVKKLTAEQLLSLKVQKQLQEEFGVKATAETDPIQLEAARLNLIKQQNLAIQAVDASYLAFIEKQMKANENAQRYADILKVIKDGKITTEEIDALAKAWGIPREAVVAYISKVTGISQTDFAGLDAPGLSAASGWDAALKKLNEYFDALKKGSTTTLPPDAASISGKAAIEALTPAEADKILSTMPSSVPTTLTPGEISGMRYAAQAAAQLAAQEKMLASIKLTNPIAQTSLESGLAGGASLSAALSGSRYAAQGAAQMGNGTVINNYITTVDPTKAGDAVVDAINSSTNIRGGFQGIGVSRAVTLL